MSDGGAMAHGRDSTAAYGREPVDRLFDGRGPALGIGTAALAVPYGAPDAVRPAPSRAGARRTLLAAVDRGVRFFDTAPAYGDAEALVGVAFGGREECVIATKLAIPPAGWESLSPREVRDHVRASAEASLWALCRERLDLLQVHNATPALVCSGPVVEALAELRADGLVARLGVTVYGEAEALAAIEAPEIDFVQVPYSALDRRPERHVLPAAAAAGKAVVARSLLLRGVLSPAGRALEGPFAPLALAADRVRSALGATWAQLPGAAVAFAATRPGIVCALLGPRDECELAALLDGVEHFGAGAREVQLPAPELPEALLDPSRWPARDLAPAADGGSAARGRRPTEVAGGR
ncbi:MAG TPA: aldo/keto reductase [Solirubrobacteraceae bacterium]|jgi:aryl-alcohol dehydrogenase-like predicted oxidoreductase|nr:aldo/keto reductase [Solirubrobacteraceae bacterium]